MLKGGKEEGTSVELHRADLQTDSRQDHPGVQLRSDLNEGTCTGIAFLILSLASLCMPGMRYCIHIWCYSGQQRS